MKKQLILGIALLVSVSSIAQKKEIKALEKAVKNSNYAEAKGLVTQLQSMEGAMDSKLKDKYYLASAKAFFSNGSGSSKDITSAVSSLDKISSTTVEVSQFKQIIENDLISKANDFYTAKDFSKAASIFESLYNVKKSDQTYLYYAASSALQAQDMDTALGYYLQLNELGYTGVSTEYFAINSASGQEEVLPKETRDKFVKIGTHTNAGERTTESKSSEIIKNIALIYAEKGENDKALDAMKQAREANPEDSSLLVNEANLHYKLGNKDKYQALISEALANDPNNPDLLYNLAVLANDGGDKVKAKEYYTKSLSLKPNNTNTLTNLAALVLSEEQDIVKVMNGLGTSAADNRKYDELKQKRTDLYKEAAPYLEKVLELKEDSVEVGLTLANIYSALGEDAKAKVLKEKYDR
ncbi:tetratricopeptide repeat protein [Olleya namhaensis]|uniref:tetratricopeptide repeat protein n=1 Tax=Olleya namhaensis TaxID=1144750 RepID=UPI00232B058E|nr:tetratricopeptide repeat protein [Olleya namhaensis]